MKFIISLLFVIFLVACSNSQNKYLSEVNVLNIVEKEYDSLRTALKDSLAMGISNVNDYNQGFKDHEKDRLDSLITEFKKQTGFRLVIFCYDSLMISKDSIQEVTRIVGIKNQISTTVGISFPNSDIYIWNDSLVNNTVLNANETNSIIDNNFLPSFRKGAFFEGTFEGIKALMQRIIINRKNKSTHKNG